MFLLPVGTILNCWGFFQFMFNVNNAYSLKRNEIPVYCHFESFPLFINQLLNSRRIIKCISVMKRRNEILSEGGFKVMIKSYHLFRYLPQKRKHGFTSVDIR